MATEAIKRIVGIGDTLKNKLLLYDALALTIKSVQLAKNKHCVLCGENPSVHDLIDYQSFVKTNQANLNQANLNQANLNQANLNQTKTKQTKVMTEQETDTEQIPTITVTELKQAIDQGPIVLIDVREPHEWNLVRIEGARLVTLGKMPHGLESLSKGERTCVYCHHGIRSKTAVRLMQQQGFSNVLSLTGGIDSWAREIEPTMPRY